MKRICVALAVMIGLAGCAKAEAPQAPEATSAPAATPALGQAAQGRNAFGPFKSSAEHSRGAFRKPPPTPLKPAAKKKKKKQIVYKFRGETS